MTNQVDTLHVHQYPSRERMGAAAAAVVAEAVDRLLSSKEHISIIFGSAPSQNEFLDALVRKPIAWDRVTAFHMDEYIGLPRTAPESFSYYLKSRLFDVVGFRAVHTIDGAAADPDAECARYAQLLSTHGLDITCMGIGENGHIAFNDPHVALFDDPDRVKVVELDQACRQQQVNDGCFADISLVPRRAGAVRARNGRIPADTDNQPAVALSQKSIHY